MINMSNDKLLIKFNNKIYKIDKNKINANYIYNLNNKLYFYIGAFLKNKIVVDLVKFVNLCKKNKIIEITSIISKDNEYNLESYNFNKLYNSNLYSAINNFLLNKKITNNYEKDFIKKEIKKIDKSFIEKGIRSENKVFYAAIKREKLNKIGDKLYVRNFIKLSKSNKDIEKSKSVVMYKIILNKYLPYIAAKPKEKYSLLPRNILLEVISNDNNIYTLLATEKKKDQFKLKKSNLIANLYNIKLHKKIDGGGINSPNNPIIFSSNPGGQYITPSTSPSAPPSSPQSSPQSPSAPQSSQSSPSAQAEIVYYDNSGSKALVINPPLDLQLNENEINLMRYTTPTYNDLGKVFKFNIYKGNHNANNIKHILKFRREFEILKKIQEEVDPNNIFTVRLKGAQIGNLKNNFNNNFSENLKDNFENYLNITKYNKHFNTNTIKDLSFCQIILEYGGVSIGVPIYNLEQNLEYIECLKAIKELVKGITMLGNNNIIHHHIIPMNVLFNKEERKLNLIDFDSFIRIDEAYKDTTIFNRSYYPSEYYILYYIIDSLIKSEYFKSYGSYEKFIIAANCNLLKPILEEFLDAIDTRTSIKDNEITKFYKERLVKLFEFYTNTTTILKILFDQLSEFIRLILKKIASYKEKTPTIEVFLYKGEDAIFGSEIAKKIDIFSMGYILLEFKKLIKEFNNGKSDHHGIKFIDTIIMMCFNHNPYNRIDGKNLYELLDAEIIQYNSTGYAGGNNRLNKSFDKYSKFLKKSHFITFNKNMDKSFNYDKWING